METHAQLPQASKLFLAASTGNLAEITKLVAAGADVNDATGNPFGEAPLHAAAFNGHDVALQLLLLLGASVDKAGEQSGSTPLHSAAAGGHVLCALQLLDKGANVNAVQRTARTPYHLAVAYNHWPLAEVLRERGADTQAKDSAGEFALDLRRPHPAPPAATDVPRLLDAFRSGRLLPPVWMSALPGAGEAVGLVDFMRALYRWLGAQNVPTDARSPPPALLEALTAEVGHTAPRHVVLVLADGLGVGAVEKYLAPSSLLRSRVRLRMRTNFPSTTAAVLSTLATARPASQHAVVAWVTYVKEAGGSVLPLKQTLPDGSPLAVAPSVVLPSLSVFPAVQQAGREVHSFSPYANTLYSDWMVGGTPQTADSSLEGLCAKLTEHLRARADRPTFSYLYWPQVDEVGHSHGWTHSREAAAVDRVDRALGRLEEFRRSMGWGGQDLTILLTADHGHMVPSASETYTYRPEQHPGIAAHLVAVAGEPRFPIFFVKSGHEVAFATAFRDAYGAAFALLAADEVEHLELFGPRPMNPEAKRRLGTFVAVSLGGSVFCHTKVPFVGFHAGMLPEEMLVPLVVL